MHLSNLVDINDLENRDDYPNKYLQKLLKLMNCIDGRQ